MTKNHLFTIIPIMLATIELSLLVSVWGYLIFSITFAVAILYVLSVGRLSKDLIDYPLLIFFIISIISGFNSSEPEKAITYAAYWLLMYLAVIAFVTHNPTVVLSKYIKFIVILIFIELITRLFLITTGIGNGIHSVASLTGAIGYLIFTQRKSFKKYIFLFIIIITSSLKIIFALFVTHFVRIKILYRASLIILVSGLYFFYIESIIDEYDDILGKVWHFNGRVSIWISLTDKFQSYGIWKQLLGDGYHIGHQLKIYNQHFYNAHNIVISLLLNNGYIGLILVSLVFLRRFYHIMFGSLSGFQTVLLVLLAINSLANSSFVAAPSLVGFLGLIIIVMTRRKIEIE